MFVNNRLYNHDIICKCGSKNHAKVFRNNKILQHLVVKLYYLITFVNG